MKTKKQFISTLFVLIGLVTIYSCGDDEEACTEETWYEDADGDGFGDLNSTMSSCDRPEGFVSNSDDADDTDPDVNPDCTELTWYEDADGDGFGNLNTTMSSCNRPEGFVSNSDDTDDTNANVNPNNTFWQESMITVTKANNADWTIIDNQDRLTDNVWLTRAGNGSIFNISSEEEAGACGGDSPLDTEWAYGTIADGIGSLTFDTFLGENFTDCSPTKVVDKDAVLHLISEDIYIDIRFLSWTGGGAGAGFSYARTTDPDCTELTWYEDADGDGFGNLNLTMSSCNRPEGFVSNSDDTDDTDPNVNPNIWQGPMMTFTKVGFSDWTLEANQDRITDNVWLTRQDVRPLFNIFISTTPTPGAQCDSDDGPDDKPLDTEWAFGTIADGIGTLTFDTFLGENFTFCDVGSKVVEGGDAVLHLISEDIYIDIRFLSWAEGGEGGGFSYERTTRN